MRPSRPWWRRLKPEERECVTFFDWCRLQRYGTHPLSDYVMHIPNERAGKITRLILAAMGVQSGVWDYLVAVPTATSPGLWIEMKLKGETAVTRNQVEFGERMTRLGWSCGVARDSYEAASLVALHMDGLVKAGKARVSLSLPASVIRSS